MNHKSRIFSTFHADDGGFSTIGMAVALLITMSLLMSSAQIYRIQRAGADIQEVADAVAIGAERQVSEFLIAVRVCDAIILTMGMTGTIGAIAGVAALCTPITAPLSEGLISASSRVFDARGTFSKNAARTLNAYQEILPFLCVLCAINIAQANSSEAKGTSYFGIAIVSPTKGETIGGNLDSKAVETMGDIFASSQEVADRAEAVEAQALKAQESKQRAWEHDCGLNPEYCQYERMASLTGNTGYDENPAPVAYENWSFGTALTRALNYYKNRLALEVVDPEDTYEEQADSTLRRIYYEYAIETLSSAYAREDEEGLHTNFPILPLDPKELKSTSLYTAELFPVTSEEGMTCMHAYEGCPMAEGYTSKGSVKDLDAGGYETCPLCQFNAYSLGNTPNATGNVSSGFEYHYRIIAEAAQEYQEARAEVEQSGDKQYVQDTVGGWINKLIELAKAMPNDRLTANPPGAHGAIAIVIDTSKASTSTGLKSFVSYEGTFGSRIAISGAAIAEEPADDGQSAILSALHRAANSETITGDALTMLASCWTAILYAYEQGQGAITDAFDDLIGGAKFLGWSSASGLGIWVKKAATAAIEGLGLQPANLDTPRAVLVNSGHVAQASQSEYAARFIAVKQTALGLAANSSVTDGLFTQAEQLVMNAMTEVKNSKYFDIATIAPFGTSWSFGTLSIILPVKSDSPAYESLGLIGSVFDAIIENINGVRRWE